jgi:hypothetical protein
MKIRKRGIAVLAVAVGGPAAFFGAQAIAGDGVPANKVVAAGSKTKVVGANQEVTLMTGTLRTSKPTDVMIHSALECSILTGITTNSSNMTGEAKSRVLVWAEVDGKIVSLEQASMPPQNGTTPPSGNEADKITFCDREYKRSVSNNETLPDGVDEQSDYIRTKSAHGFNWVQMNLGSGIHTVAIKARFTTAATPNAQAEAIVGNRTLIVEPTKMANDAIISQNGTY